MSRWFAVIVSVVIIAFIALCATSTIIGRGGKRFVGPGRVVHAFPDGKQLVLLQIDYGREHQFTYRQKSFLSEVRATQQASAWGDSLCLWLAIYDPRTNHWEKPEAKDALLTIGENLYPKVERSSGGESLGGGGLLRGGGAGNDAYSTVPRPVAVLFAPEPAAQRRAEARLWLDKQAQPVQFAFELPATLPSPAPPAQALPRTQTQRVGALTVEFRGLKFADHIIGDSAGTFLAPEIRVLHNGKPLKGWKSFSFDIEPAQSPLSFASLSLPPADAPVWTVRVSIECDDLSELVRDAFSDYVDVAVPAPRAQQVVPIMRSLKIDGAQLKVLALVGAGELRYRVGEPLPRQAAPLAADASAAYQISAQEAHIVAPQPYLLCELTLPWQANGSGSANWGSLTLSSNSGDQVSFLVKGLRIDSRSAMKPVVRHLRGTRMLVAVPLEPTSVSGRQRVRFGLSRTRSVNFQMSPLEAARVARTVRNALAWRALGDQQRFESTMRDCLRRYRQSKDPTTLTYLGLLCTAAELPPEEFVPLIAPLSELARREPNVYAYQIALGAVLTRAGRPQEAARRYQQLNIWWSHDGLAQMWRALAFVEMGRRDEAKRFLNPSLLQSWRSSVLLLEDDLRYKVIDLLVAEYERKGGKVDPSGGSMR